MRLKGKRKVDYESALGELEGQRRRATSVPGRWQEQGREFQGGARGSQRREEGWCGEAATQAEESGFIPQKLAVTLKSLPYTSLFKKKKKKLEKADVVGS